MKNYVIIAKMGGDDMRKLYPGGKRKAFNITYDDGVMQDGRFVVLLNRFGLKGTFNLNSQLMEEEFAWIHPCGMEVKRLGFGEIQVSFFKELSSIILNAHSLNFTLKDIMLSSF